MENSRIFSSVYGCIATNQINKYIRHLIEGFTTKIPYIGYVLSYLALQHTCKNAKTMSLQYQLNCIVYTKQTGKKIISLNQKKRKKTHVDALCVIM